jgi:beta-glucosidase
MKRLALALAVLCAFAAAPSASAAGRCGDHPWCDTSLSPDARAQLLLDALTQTEKIDLLGGDDLFGVSGAEGTHTGTSDGIERVGLPPTYYNDGPVGVREGLTTAMPTPLALAATFDPELAFRHGATIGNEAKLKGHDVVFAPNVNIMRTPAGGRTFEAYGEDPYLVSRLTVGWIRGLQSEGVIGNVKHYAANNQEGDAGGAANTSRPGQPVGPPNASGNRLSVNAVIDERTLREVYLPQFEAAVKEANVGSVMCAYNRVNGFYACENEHLLEDVLKGEWGFDGYVLADYGAAHNTAASLNNGLDFEPWPGFTYGPTPVTLALASGQVSAQTIDEHVRRILRTHFAYGFFDRDAHPDDESLIDKAGHARTAQEIAEAGMTLMRNEGGALPLDNTRLRSIAVIGGDADEFKSGGGSGAVRPFTYKTIREAIAERAGPGVETRYDDGSEPDRAAEVARGSDVALVFAGDYQSEFSDKDCLSLQCPPYRGDQDALIEAVAAANPNTVVVLTTGGPVLTPWRGRVRAIVQAWYPGQEGGTAIARVLFGDVDPGGRLPATFPQREEDVPTAGDPEKYPGVGENVYYKEGVFVGHRWYDARGIEPAFPFGFGLSYTRFRMRDVKLRRTGPRSARVRVTVVNRGDRTGVAVPQLYLGLPEPSADVPQPPRQLKGARRITLEPGQRRRVRFDIGERALSYWEKDSATWQVARGCYRVFVGSSSRSIAGRAAFGVGGARCPKQRVKRCKRVRRFFMHTDVLRNRVRRVKVFVNGRRQRTVFNRRGLVRVKLPARRRARVRLVVRTTDGRRVVRRKTYGPCSPKRRPHRRR